MKYYLLLTIIGTLTISCNQTHEDVKIPGSYKALEMFSKGRAFPNSDIPKGGYSEALDYHQAEFVDGQVNFRDDRPWEAMGPKNTTGRTLTIGFNPQNARTIYAGSASGGLWRSYAAGDGNSWEYVETGFPILGVSTIAFAPADSTVMYIGTGEVYNYDRTGDDGAYRATRGSYGFGILKSEDGGATWSKSLDWSYEQRKGIWMIKVSQDNSNIVTAATTDGIYRSTDAGGTWTQLTDIIMATDVEVDPSNSDRMVAAFGNLGSADRGIYVTEDGGLTWTQSSGIPTQFQGKILLAMYEQDSNILYASIGNGFTSADAYTWLARSDDFGKTWQVVNETDYSRWQGWFSHDVAVHPTDPNRIMIIGIDIWNSTDGGVNLNKRSSGGVTLGTPPAGQPDGPQDYSHSDHHFVAYHPANPDHIYFANDGGVFKSTDGGLTFASANGGMQTTQFYHGFVVSPLDENLAMGGLQDNSTSIFRGDDNWQRAIGGDGSWSAISPDDENVVFGSWQYLNILKSTNGGQNFLGINLPAGNDNPLFIAPYAIAPSNSDRIYAAGRNIYSSDNEGISWDTKFLGVNSGHDPFFSLEIAPSDADVAYFGTSPETEQTQIMSTRDGGNTWQTNTTELPLRIVNDMSVDANDPAIVYAALSGFGSNHVYKSTDYGINWEAIDSNLPDVPTNAIQVDPNNSDHLYVGNDIGVYFSEDGGGLWTFMDVGLPMAMIAMDFAISPKDHKIWIATHGNGTYRADLVSTPVSSTTENNSTKQIAIYPNPARDVITLSTHVEIAEVNIYSLDGKIVQRSRLSTSKQLNIGALPVGQYYLTASDQGKVFGKAQFVKVE